MNNMRSFLDFAISAAFVVILFFTIYLGIRSKRAAPQFDERQIAARGKAFEAGFCTFIICNAVLAIADTFDIHWATSTAIEIFLTILISIGAFSVTAIIKDAYLGFNENHRSSIGLLALVAVINLIVGMGSIISGEESFLENGKAGHTVLNFAITVLFAVVIITNLAHKKRQSFPSDEEMTDK